MAGHKFHIGENGPAPCRARFRACKYEINGDSLEELNSIWEKQQEALFEDTMLTGVSKSGFKWNPELNEAGNENLTKLAAEWTLSKKSRYSSQYGWVNYSDSDRNIAVNLALTNLTELSYTPIEKQDEEWRSNGHTDVRRYILEDGSVGYFKSLYKNSESEDMFQDYSTTSLGASINEVNAYRMAKALGNEYAEMVPETVIREVDGLIGTFQREVKESTATVSYDEGSSLREDVRRAAIFDFVIGNQDRHNGNFIYGESGEGEDSRPCIRLIDHSFSFLPKDAALNNVIFTENDFDETTLNDSEMKFTGKDIDSLTNARAAVKEWVSAKTIDADLGERTIRRIDYLMDVSKVSSLYHYDRLTFDRRDWSHYISQPTVIL